MIVTTNVRGVDTVDVATYAVITRVDVSPSRRKGKLVLLIQAA